MDPKPETTTSTEDAASVAFLSRMSHELRAPLNSVIGYAQLLEMRYDDPVIVEASQSILRAGRHLLEVIGDLLELSKFEQCDLPCSTETVSLRESIVHAVDILRPIADHGRVQVFVLEPPSKHDLVAGDRQRLLQVFINLVSNAIKYNHPGGSVWIECTGVRNGKCRVEVRDTGTGIPAVDLGRLFQPFQRLGDPAIEGTGLGLVLSQRFMRHMVGSLELAASGPSGSTFALELAVAPVASAKAAVFVHESVVGYPRRNCPVTLLYIDGSLQDVRIVELALRGLPGVRLIPAGLGSLGLELARELRPDLVLLGLDLPDMTAQDVTRLLKDSPVTASAPVVVVGAGTDAELTERLLRLGADEFWTKPIDLQRLSDVVGRRLSSIPQSRRQF